MKIFSGIGAVADADTFVLEPMEPYSSEDLGESGELLAEAAGTGEWLEGEKYDQSTAGR